MNEKYAATTKQAVQQYLLCFYLRGEAVNTWINPRECIDHLLILKRNLNLITLYTVKINIAELYFRKNRGKLPWNIFRRLFCSAVVKGFQGRDAGEKKNKLSC